MSDASPISPSPGDRARSPTAADATAPASPAASRRKAWSLVAHAAAGAAGHPGAVSRHRASLRRRPTPIATSSPERWGLNLINLRAAEPSAGLWQTSTDACCARHKVEPLFSALEGYDVWFTGLRREQSPRRANLQKSSRSGCRAATSIRKVSPLAAWTTRDVWQYAKAHDIPLLPLYELGYTSIGCEPCTTLPLDPNDPRSGRWQGQKLECGIHIQPR